MKKSLLAVVAALAIAGCSQTEIDGIDNGEKAKNVEMEFSTGIGKASRAADYVDQNLRDAGMKVYSYLTDNTTPAFTDTYMDGVLYTYDTAWEPSIAGTTYYWPKDKYLHFIAVPNGASYANQTISATDGTDLVVAYLPEQNASSNSGKVSLSFKHILTKVNFETSLTETSDNGLILKIGSITLKGVIGGSAATYNIIGNSWNLGSISAKEYSYDPTEAKPSLMLFPQTFTTNPTVEVTYTVENKIGDKTYIVDSGTKIASIPTSTVTWIPGKNIKYSLGIPFKGTKMTVDALVDEWDEEVAGDTPVNN